LSVHEHASHALDASKAQKAQGGCMTSRTGTIPILRSAPQETLEHLVDQGPNRFRVHTRAYTDRAIFDAEMDRIFNRIVVSWVFSRRGTWTAC
jgi:hypothetical protein